MEWPGNVLRQEIGFLGTVRQLSALCDNFRHSETFSTVIQQETLKQT